MTNLQYEIRIPQKINRRVTIHYCAWYDFLRNRRYNVILHIDHGNNKWWQKEKGAKCHQKKKEKFKVEPKKYVTNFTFSYA